MQAHPITVDLKQIQFTAIISFHLSPTAQIMLFLSTIFGVMNPRIKRSLMQLKSRVAPQHTQSLTHIGAHPWSVISCKKFVFLLAYFQILPLFLTATLNLCLIYFKITWTLYTLIEHMHKKFEINQTKIKGICQSGRKVMTQDSWGTTFLPNWQPPLIFVWFT